MSFILKNYGYQAATKTAWFEYMNNGFAFRESYTFSAAQTNYNQEALDRALFLAFVLVGTSYYKTFPSREITLEKGEIDEWQAHFFNKVYQEGMSQFAYEHGLKRGDLAKFEATGNTYDPVEYTTNDTKPIILQSGGKDSLLLANLLIKNGTPFDALHITSSETYPSVIDQLQINLLLVRRHLDIDTLREAGANGAKSGHVPITYIVFAITLLQAVLCNKATVLAAIGHEGEEPYAHIDDLPVAHQWSKIWSSEQALAEYVSRYISSELFIGSPLRRYSELKVAELFVKYCWADYSRKFSSCNVGNYKQGQNNTELGWCGNCAKCANSYLLFAPFVEPDELAEVFNGENLFSKDSLSEVFKGLLGVDEAIKPFECVGETDELRLAYQMAHANSVEYTLPFSVPKSDFDYQKEYPAQPWTDKYV